MSDKKKTKKQREAETISLLREARDFIRAKACHYSGPTLSGSGAELVQRIDQAIAEK